MDLIKFIGVVVMGLALAIVSINLLLKAECKAKTEGTRWPTRYSAMGGCQAQVDGIWIDYDAQAAFLLNK